MNILRTTVFTMAAGVLAFGMAPAQEEDPLLKKKRTSPPAADSGTRYYERGGSAISTYEETIEKKEKEVRKTGGIVGKLVEEGDKIDNVGADKKKPTARWDFSVEPKLTLNPDGTGKVTLKLTERPLSISGDMPKESAAQCEMDAAGAKAAINDWSRALSKEDIQALEAGKIFRYPLDRLFDGFRRLSRPTIEVSVGLAVDKLRIDGVSMQYGMLEVRRHQLQNEITKLTDDLKRRTTMMEDARKAWEAKKAALAAEEAKLGPVAEKLAAAAEKVKAAMPAKEAKSASYLDLEKQLAEAQARADQILQRLLEWREVTKNESPEARAKLESEFDEVTAQAKRLREYLEKSPEHKKFLQDREALLKKGADGMTELQSALEAYYAQLKTCTHRRSDLALASMAVDFAVRTVEETQADLDHAKESLAQFKLLKPPYFTQVSAQSTGSGGVYYRGSYWNPEPVLALLDQHINALRPMRAHLKDRRDELLPACWEAMAECEVALRDYSWAVTKSRFTQQLTEWFVYLYDCLDTGRQVKDLKKGVLMETGKKALEWAVFGIPMPVEGDSTSLDGVELLKKQLVPRGFKTMVSGPAAKIAVTQYMRNEAEKEFARKCEEWFATRAWATFGPNAGLSSATDAFANNAQTAAILGIRVNAVLEASAALTEAKKDAVQALKSGVLNIGGRSFKEAAMNFGEWLAGPKPKVTPSSFKEWLFYQDGFIKGAMTKFFFGLAKDVAKSATKQELANYFENDAFLACVEKELIFTKLAAVRYDLGVLLGQVDDMLEFFTNARNEILRQYDQENHFKIKDDREFKTSENLWINLECTVPGTEILKNYEVEVKLGGIKLERKSDVQLQYLAPSDALRAASHMAGKTKLEVTILAR